MYKIVLLDDEENIINALKRLMKKEKEWEVYGFTDAAKALDFILQNDIAVVISDYQMPSMNGTNFLKQVKTIQPDSMRFILSGYADLAALMNAINSAEIYRYICKPIDEFELFSCIHRAINHRDMILENARLADITRQQQLLIDKQQESLDKILLNHPDIAIVDRDDDGAIIINEDDYQ